MKIIFSKRVGLSGVDTITVLHVRHVYYLENTSTIIGNYKESWYSTLTYAVFIFVSLDKYNFLFLLIDQTLFGKIIKLKVTDYVRK